VNEYQDRLTFVPLHCLMRCHVSRWHSDLCVDRRISTAIAREETSRAIQMFIINHNFQHPHSSPCLACLDRSNKSLRTTPCTHYPRTGNPRHPSRWDDRNQTLAGCIGCGPTLGKKHQLAARSSCVHSKLEDILPSLDRY
jgi:hypothetical protein